MKFQSFVILSCVFLVLGVVAESDVLESDEKLLSRQKRKIFFPQNSVLQLSMCIIAQISSLTSHRVAINAGFQINYGLPFRLQDFVSPVFWARAFSNESNPMINFFERLAQSEKYDNVEEDEADDQEFEEDQTEDDSEVATTEIYTTSTAKHRRRKPKSKRDLSAGQFYSGLKELMEYTGYHEDCLLKSVCELAQHPLHDDEDNVVNEALHFILTPSLHKSFDHETEAEEKKLFEEAEEFGKAGMNCEHIYGSNCMISPLHKISGFNFQDLNDV